MFFRTSTFDDVTRLFNEVFGEMPGVNTRALPVAAGETLPTRRLASRVFPAVESYTRDGKLVLRAELPGIGQDEIDVTVEDGQLTLSGTRKTEDESDDREFHFREMRYGSFERTFTLPDGVNPDEVTARLDNGVLEISMPLVERPGGRKIEVSVDNGHGKKAAHAA